MHPSCFTISSLSIRCCALQDYRTGRMLTGEVKKKLIDILVTLVERHRRARSAVTEEVCCIDHLCFLS